MEKKNLAILIVLLCGLFGAAGQLLIKIGSEKIVMTNLLSVINPYIIVGFALYFFATFFFIYALKYGEVTLLYPLVALNYVWVNGLSIMYLGEANTSLKWIGNASIIFGVVMIGLSEKVNNHLIKMRSKRGKK